MLQLLAALVKYGYYDDASDVNDLLPSLYKLLDGKNDFPTKKIKQAMMSDDGEEISQRMCQLLYIIKIFSQYYSYDYTVVL